MTDAAVRPRTDHPSFRQALKVWATVGVLSFGGPAGQIALMNRVLVDERRWLTEEEFLHALNFCMLLPGPEAMQLATYAGWRLHGWRGGLAAGLLFVVPGAVVILILGALYAAYGQVTLVAGLFYGIKAAVLAIVVEALLRVARKSLKRGSDWLIATAAFAALFFFALPFPLVVLTAAFFGYLRASGATAPAGDWNRTAWQHTALTALGWLALWLVPVLALILSLGSDHVFSQVALFFSKLAIVTFGGAYAVLAYMAQQAVEVHGWLKPAEMVDGLGLAETTPGPLILVTEFVGYLAGYRLAGGFLGGVAAALITLWVTFVPCFLMIFTAAPYIERLRSMPRLSAALEGITAAVVGVIFNLTVWFALHVLFGRVARASFGPVHTLVPDFSTINPGAVVLLALAAVLLFRLHAGIPATLATCSALGFVLYLLF